MGQGLMRSSDEGSAVSSTVLNLGGVPLEQLPALASVTEPMVQRILTGSSVAAAPATSFASSI
jgi:hypothetical protein